MDSRSDVVDYLWRIGYFKEFRQRKDIVNKIYNDFGLYCTNINSILKQKRFKKKIKKFVGGWREIMASSPKGIKKEEEAKFKEIKEALGDAFKKELEELEIVFNECPNSTAFLMRKILEKLLFIVVSKSNNKKRIEYLKQEENRLPSLTELLSIAKNAEINKLHIITPKNIDKLGGSKFLGDTAAHNYLISVGFEDIKQEIAIWRISIKELANNL